MANSICFEGIIRWIGVKKEGVSQSSGKAWASLDFMIEEQDGQYPQSVVCTIFGEDKIASMMPTLNEVVTAHLDFKARSYTKDGKTSTFTSINCWKLERPNESVQQPQQSTQQSSTTNNSDPFAGSDNDSSLPF